jgi:hypothetical protein
MENKSTKKSVIIVFVIILVAIVSSVVTFGVLRYRNAYNEKIAYYGIDTSDTDELYELSNSNDLIYDTKANRIFESNCLGNYNTNLLSYGCIYSDGEIKIVSTDNIVLEQNGQKIKISGTPGSYINRIGDSVYYRNDEDRKVYHYSIKSQETHCLIEKQCGEVIVSTKGIAFINYESEFLSYYSFEAKDIKCLSEEKLIEFATVGNKYFCLAKNGNLFLLDEAGKSSLVEKDVDKFYYAGNIVIQKKDNIFVLNNSILNKLSSKNIKGRLVGCDDKRIYIIADKDISSYDIQDGKFIDTVTTLSDGQVLKSLYIVNDGYELIVMNKTNEQYVSRNISIK